MVKDAAAKRCETDQNKCRHFVKLTLKKMVEKKLITQVKGQGATGSFKLLKAAVIKPKKVVKKVLKKVAKKSAAKKTVAKKVVAKKAATKKAPKPSGAAKLKRQQPKKHQRPPQQQKKPQLRRLSNKQLRPTELHQLHRPKKPKSKLPLE